MTQQITKTSQAIENFLVLWRIFLISDTPDFRSFKNFGSLKTLLEPKSPAHRFFFSEVNKNGKEVLCCVMEH